MYIEQYQKRTICVTLYALQQNNQVSDCVMTQWHHMDMRVTNYRK